MLDNKYHINLLPHGRQIDVKPGISLMEALMEQSIFLRSDCGGKGVCKKCRVKTFPSKGDPEFKKACTFTVSEDISIEIPESSMLSSHIITKAPASLPKVFKDLFKDVKAKDAYGIAVDLGTTTIAIYLCNTIQGKIISSLAVKNPQALYGDDVMSRIGTIGQDKKNLGRLQKLVVRAIEWGIKELLASLEFKDEMISKMVAVGNPTMIHILAGIDPKSIGISPYLPAFYEARQVSSKDMGFAIKEFPIQLLPQVSGFIGGDILSAALAVDLENQPKGTLLVDLGTNGELMLKGKDRYFATSCATGPAFEGATLACGMQAIPGAINKVKINGGKILPEYTFINPSNSSGLKPSGICGTGVISCVAQFCKQEIIALNGAFSKEASKKNQFVLVPENLSANGSDVFISQKDIRSVQLGKAALITGIEFLLKEAGFDSPEKIIIAGAFGTFLDKRDMMALGMIPDMDFEKVEVAGNSAGAGAIMALCDNRFLEKAIQMPAKIIVVDLACNKDFQDVFVQKLSFPSWKN
jgi:uncharacterized 2Fe-2S/4Fe-4S cluster protein (DUF4445 family)